MLRGFGFILVRTGNIRHETDVNEHAVFPADVERKLSYCLEEMLRFYIAYRTADFGYYDVRPGHFGVFTYKPLGLVRDVRNYLHGLAEIFAAAFFFDDRIKHLAGRKVGKFIQVDARETLVMPEVEVGFRPVFGDENFAVLEGIHRSRVDVHIWVQFLYGYRIAALSQQSSERCRHNALAEPRNDAPGYEYILSIFHKKFSRKIVQNPNFEPFFARKNIKRAFFFKGFLLPQKKRPATYSKNEIYITPIGFCLSSAFYNFFMKIFRKVTASV